MGFSTVEKRVIGLFVAYMFICWFFLMLEDRGFFSRPTYFILLIVTAVVFLVMAVLLKKNGFFKE